MNKTLSLCDLPNAILLQIFEMADRQTQQALAQLNHKMHQLSKKLLNFTNYQSLPSHVQTSCRDLLDAKRKVPLSTTQVKLIHEVESHLHVFTIAELIASDKFLFKLKEVL